MPIAIVKCIVYIYLMVLLPQIDAHQREQIVETTPQIAWIECKMGLENIPN